jgi:hypothetical protein
VAASSEIARSIATTLSFGHLAFIFKEDITAREKHRNFDSFDHGDVALAAGRLAHPFPGLAAKIVGTVIVLDRVPGKPGVGPSEKTLTPAFWARWNGPTGWRWL